MPRTMTLSLDDMIAKLKLAVKAEADDLRRASQHAFQVGEWLYKIELEYGKGARIAIEERLGKSASYYRHRLTAVKSFPKGDPAREAYLNFSCYRLLSPLSKENRPKCDLIIREAIKGKWGYAEVARAIEAGECRSQPQSGGRRRSSSEIVDTAIPADIPNDESCKCGEPVILYIQSAFEHGYVCCDCAIVMAKVANQAAKRMRTIQGSLAQSPPTPITR